MLCRLSFLTVLVACGCGPLVRPMAERVDADTQQQIDDGWNRALAPVDKLDREEWLDVFVGAQVYQYGVDKLHFRSEKKVDSGLVVMEVKFDRASPDDDKFIVQFQDSTGKVVREENYARDEVDGTFRELFDQNSKPEDPQKREALEQEGQARWEKIQEFFPKRDSEKTKADADANAADDR